MGKVNPIGDRNPAFVLKSGLYPSVTRVLDLVPKPFLIPWAAKIAIEGAVLLNGNTTHNYNDITAQSRTLGTAVHNMIAAELKGILPDPIPDGPIKEAAGRAFKIWDDNFNMDGEIVSIEEPMESHKLGLNGRADLIIRSTNGLEIIDWKTSPNLYAETRLEMAAYALLASEKYSEPVVALHAMRIDYTMNATFTIEKDMLDIDEYADDALLFEQLLAVFRPLQAWQAQHHS